jgi:hypothetical protein
VETVRDFEDLLQLFERFGVRYLIIGGLAFTFHAKPRYTKDIDLWLDPATENVERANRALAAFGSPYPLDADQSSEILQLGVPPNRIDLLRDPGGTSGLRFDGAWRNRVESRYGEARAYWIDLDGPIAIKSGIDHPRHQDDARILREVRARGSRRGG